MIKRVEEYDRYVAMAGFKEVSINLDYVFSQVREELPNVAVQLFDARKIAGWQHLFFASLNALKVFDNGTNISRNLAVECILYVAAQRQIRIALNLVGIKHNSSNIAVLVVASNESAAKDSIAKVSRMVCGKRDDTVLDLTDEKVPHIRKLFNISEVEMSTKLEKNREKESLIDLVLEHVALLVTKQ